LRFGSPCHVDDVRLFLELASSLESALRGGWATGFARRTARKQREHDDREGAIANRRT
jgi:hypothetical protein